MLTLPEWLSQIAKLHPQEIVLGLDRIKTVASRLNLKQPACPVIVVAGTNGKGSCVAALESIYLAAGYSTGVFTSPVLSKHNELVRLSGRVVEDDFFCNAYEKIEAARGEIMLTAFEFHTLAALEILSLYSLDVWVLEVGLGGRLDAVNIIDADVAVITSIGIDHVEWLGNTRDLIAKEKAGIFRKNHPAVCGDFDPPASLLNHAEELRVPLYCQGKEFSFDKNEHDWSWRSFNKTYSSLPITSLYVPNLAASIMAMELMQDKLPVSAENVYLGIKNAKLPGRFEVSCVGTVTIIKDVAHNPDGVKLLAERMHECKCKNNYAVFSMLGDKDIQGSIREIKDKIDGWYIAALPVERGASLEVLKTAFMKEGIKAVKFFDSIEQAYKAALGEADSESCIWVFGSFYTVGECSPM
ncbi:MAG TPA: bifunctional tetrahydrofolate synthase/dihydrofolate synthase [Gammaproteobacteria bacterium]|nr:bifunctional tetrahydrofolate synthase/dihydrofolate synthase [Gammaproteobacteria bacterium]